MTLEEALRMKKIKIREHAGYDLVPGESGIMIRKYRVIERDATLEDVLSFNPETGVFVTKDGRKYGIYEV